MKALGLILAGGKNERLGDLNAVRATSAMPVGSCYRAIDFTLSNMSNSGINKIAVITQYNSRSLHDHLTSSKWWDLGRKQGGLFVFTPFSQNDNNSWFRGTADSMYQNISFLKRSNEPYAVIASGNSIYKIDFNEVIKYHIQKESDITIISKNITGSGIDVRDFGVLELDSDMRIVDFEEKPIETSSSIISLGIYVLPRVLLIKLLESALAEARYHFVNDILIRYRKKLKMHAYMFDGYWTAINSVDSYYQANMDFLDRGIRNELLGAAPHIETKPKDEPPAKFNYKAETSNCLVGSGSILNGKSENSVLFRRVFTGEGSVVRDSILLEGCFIGNNCVVENAILDKDVILSDGKQVVGALGQPLIIKKGMVV